MNYKIEDCFAVIRNGANIKQGTEDGGFPITRIETISNDQFNRDRMGYAGINDIDKYSDHVLEDGDLLMSHINSPKYLGRTVVYHKNQGEVVIHGMNLLKLRTRRELLVPDFVEYLFSTFMFRNQIGKIMKKSVNQASFSTKDLKEIIINVPSLMKQSEIVNRLHKVKQILNDRNRQVELFDELIKSRFVEMFGDPIINSKSLPLIKLGDACDMKAGKNKKAANINEVFEKGLYPCFGGNGIRGYVEEYSHEGNIVLVGRQGALCGNLQYATGQIYATEHAIVIQSKIGWNPLWIYIMLREMNLNRLATGAAQPGINVGTLVHLEVISPIIEKQNEYSEFVQQVDKLKTEVKKSLDETQILFDSLMQEYFE